MSLNIIGNNKVYTVKEIDALFDRASGFVVVDTLPPAVDAKANLIYYKKAKDTVKDVTGYANPNNTSDTSEEKDSRHTQAIYTERPALIPYIVGTDSVTGNKVWYTTGTSIKHEPLTEEEVKAIWDSVTAEEED